MSLSLDAKTFRVRRGREELDLPVLFRAGGFVMGSENSVLKVNARPPALETETLAGNRVSLEALRGKVVLINFWATWCEPCIAEMPDLARLQEKFGPEKFVILSINLDDGEGTLKDYLVKNPLPFLLVHSPGMGSKLPSRYGVNSLPTNILLDKNGYIMQFSTGYRMSAHEEFLGRAIAELLKEASSDSSQAAKPQP